MARIGMLNLIYVLLAGGVLAFYAVSEYAGWEFFSPSAPRRVRRYPPLARLVAARLRTSLLFRFSRR